MNKTTKLVLPATVYVMAIIAANSLTARYGLVPVGFGLTATAGTFAAGLALGARDILQDAGGRAYVLAMILVGVVLSAVTSTPTLAVASGCSFLISETVDFFVYTPLRTHSMVGAVVASNLVGGLVDTIVFLHLAGFPVTGLGVGGQLVGKVLWATLIPVAAVSVWRAVRNRAVPVHPVVTGNPQGNV